MRVTQGEGPYAIQRCCWHMPWTSPRLTLRSILWGDQPFLWGTLMCRTQCTTPGEREHREARFRPLDHRTQDLEPLQGDCSTAGRGMPRPGPYAFAPVSL